MRLIDADEVLKRWGLKFYAMGGDRLGPNGDEISFYVNGLLNEIQNAPTVDFEKLGESLRCQIRAEYGSCDDCELSCPRNELIKLLDSERPTGHWEYVTYYCRRYRVCSVCHAEKLDDRATGWNYCQHCGADMRGDKV